jgi:hypothetical protein
MTTRPANAARPSRDSLDNQPRTLALDYPALELVSRHTHPRPGRDTAARPLYVILDGTLVPIDRVADQRPYSGKHKRHGVNPEVLPSSRRQLLWASPGCPARSTTYAPTLQA